MSDLRAMMAAKRRERGLVKGGDTNLGSPSVKSSGKKKLTELEDEDISKAQRKKQKTSSSEVQTDLLEQESSIERSDTEGTRIDRQKLLEDVSKKYLAKEYVEVGLPTENESDDLVAQMVSSGGLKGINEDSDNDEDDDEDLPAAIRDAPNTTKALRKLRLEMIRAKQAEMKARPKSETELDERYVPGKVKFSDYVQEMIVEEEAADREFRKPDDETLLRMRTIAERAVDHKLLRLLFTAEADQKWDVFNLIFRKRPHLFDALMRKDGDGDGDDEKERQTLMSYLQEDESGSLIGDGSDDGQQPSRSSSSSCGSDEYDGDYDVDFEGNEHDLDKLFVSAAQFGFVDKATPAGYNVREEVEILEDNEDDGDETDGRKVEGIHKTFAKDFGFDSSEDDELESSTVSEPKKKKKIVTADQDSNLPSDFFQNDLNERVLEGKSAAEFRSAKIEEEFERFKKEVEHDEEKRKGELDEAAASAQESSLLELFEEEEKDDATRDAVEQLKQRKTKLSALLDSSLSSTDSFATSTFDLFSVQVPSDAESVSAPPEISSGTSSDAVDAGLDMFADNETDDNLWRLRTTGSSPGTAAGNVRPSKGQVVPDVVPAL